MFNNENCVHLLSSMDFELKKVCKRGRNKYINKQKTNKKFNKLY